MANAVTAADIGATALLEQQILTYLRTQVPQAEQLDVQTDLLEAAILDSLMVADLFVWMETQLKVKLAASDITPQNFRSVECLGRLVAGKRHKEAKVA